MGIAFGEKVKTLRKQKKMTLEALANKIGSGKSYIWELENKGVTRPSAEKITQISLALGVTTEYLMDEAQESPEDSVIDQAYFRKYQKLTPDTKKKIQQMIDAWEDDD
jgi:transcriptional regulator with XRE-family HTH domain